MTTLPLIELIQFAYKVKQRQQNTKNIGSIPKNASYRADFFYEDDPDKKLPGVTLNTQENIWISVARLTSSESPKDVDKLLRPWLNPSDNPNQDPSLKKTIEKATPDPEARDKEPKNPLRLTYRNQQDNEPENLFSLISLDQQHKEPKDLLIPYRDQQDKTSRIRLEDFPQAEKVRSLFEKYLKDWTKWASKEKPRRKTIALYQKLYRLEKNLKEGDDKRSELVLGVGIGNWKSNKIEYKAAIIQKQVEVSRNNETKAFEIRPTREPAQVNLEWYKDQDLNGANRVEAFAEQRFASNPLSPFEPDTYRDVLEEAVLEFDPQGVLHTRVPPAKETLQITDIWVVFAREKNNHRYLKDLENLKTVVENLNDPLPPAVAELFTQNLKRARDLPEFRGVSTSYQSAKSKKTLYFPKPYNNEQVQIIQHLFKSNGVVVQGPPGTGKTHTIANIICHFLATGQRVLVTAMKETPLAVLHDQLPEKIKPLVLAHLKTEQEGDKKFRDAIEQITNEVLSINTQEQEKEIQRLEEKIDRLHANLAGIERRISDIYEKNGPIELDGETIQLEDVNLEEDGRIIPDPITIDPKFNPLFRNEDIQELRQLRKSLGQDLDYLNASLPPDLPGAQDILKLHQKLSKHRKLIDQIDNREIPKLSPGISEAQLRDLLDKVQNLKRIRSEIEMNDKQRHFKECLRSSKEIIEWLNSLGEELDKIREENRPFSDISIEIKEKGLLDDPEILQAITNLSQGRRPFGFFGIFSEKKNSLKSIQIDGKELSNADEWKQVKSYLALRERMNRLCSRWNNFAGEFGLPRVDVSQEGYFEARGLYEDFQKVAEMDALEEAVWTQAWNYFLPWEKKISDPNMASEIERIASHHLALAELAPDTNKQTLLKQLDKKNGRIIARVREAINSLGNPNLSDNEAEREWMAARQEFSRVQELLPKLESVRRVTKLIEESGAPKYAKALREPLEGETDLLLPLNLKDLWKQKRLTAHLITLDDSHKDLKNSFDRQQEDQNRLARTYQDVVVARTLLKLSASITPIVKQNLQIYKQSIQSLGKGTGKRAFRHRQYAQEAFEKAYKAIPCWIMSHDRISETFPATLGDFDLVIIDEASQSDFQALPALLRSKKILVVGDDKQVSPTGIGIREEEFKFLRDDLKFQVEDYKKMMSPENSIYDLFKVVYSESFVMLKEHFRCVGPIIAYSNRTYYGGKIEPLRSPKASERLDPPLIDVFVEGGSRKGDTNRSEAKFIIQEIKQIVEDERLRERSIGIVTLLGDRQKVEIENLLFKEVDQEDIERHRITCGNQSKFQGQERDIMFLSMVVSPNQVHATDRIDYEQRYNVAASRARDRMYLVRSVKVEDLSIKDVLRRGLIGHFSNPRVPVPQDEKNFESRFERQVYEALVEEGYRVIPQVRVGKYRIDLVVEGENDARLAIECDGDWYHEGEKRMHDFKRQRDLERLGWSFWRCWYTEWARRRSEVLDDLFKTLKRHKIDPLGEEKSKERYYEQRIVRADELDIHEPEIVTGRSDGFEGFDDDVILLDPPEFF